MKTELVPNLASAGARDFQMSDQTVENSLTLIFASATSSSLIQDSHLSFKEDLVNFLYLDQLKLFH